MDFQDEFQTITFSDPTRTLSSIFAEPKLNKLVGLDVPLSVVDLEHEGDNIAHGYCVIA